MYILLFSLSNLHIHTLKNELVIYNVPQWPLFFDTSGYHDIDHEDNHLLVQQNLFRLSA